MKATLKEYKQIAEKTKETWCNMHELFRLTREFPKKTSSNSLFRVQKALSKFKSDMEDKMFQDHPGLGDEGIEIFYGMTCD